MEFYKDCLGGELNLQTLGDSPFGKKFPEKMKNNILHAELKADRVTLMGSDMTPHDGLIKGNNISILLFCKSEIELLDIFQKLAGNGDENQISETHSGSLRANLTDKFGHHWMLDYSKKNS